MLHNQGNMKRSLKKTNLYLYRIFLFEQQVLFSILSSVLQVQHIPWWSCLLLSYWQLFLWNVEMQKKVSIFFNLCLVDNSWISMFISLYFKRQQNIEMFFFGYAHMILTIFVIFIRLWLKDVKYMITLFFWFVTFHLEFSSEFSIFVISRFSSMLKKSCFWLLFKFTAKSRLVIFPFDFTFIWTSFYNLTMKRLVVLSKEQACNLMSLPLHHFTVMLKKSHEIK